MHRRKEIGGPHLRLTNAASRMTRSMITHRQKARSDESAPVLFRLPNLRSRNMSAVDLAVPVTAAIDVDGSFQRVDTPAVSSGEQLADNTTSVTTGQASGDVTMTATSPSPIPSPSPPAKGRGWMERIGSRLILFITLVAIVSAAWLTGQRMPASKPDVWQASAVNQAEIDASLNSDGADRRVANAVSEPTVLPLPVQPSTLTKSPLNDFAVIASSPGNTFGTGSPQDTAATLTAPANKSFPPQPLPTSVYKPSMDTGVDSSTEDVSSIFNAETNEPNELGDAAMNGVQVLEPFYQGDSVTAAPENIGLANQQSTAPQTVSTTTPRAPVFEPGVLLPWFDEQNASRENRVSVTPNPIVDWSLYLPGADQTVRAASATQTPSNTTTTQQAGFPNGVTVNPYNR